MIDENELLKNLELYLNQTLLGEITVQTELSVGEICSLIKDCPTVDAKTVRRGKWIKSEIPCEEFVCSECGGACWYYDVNKNVSKSKYCPNCGAKMS